MSSFLILFNTYKNLLSKHPDSGVTNADIQCATKKMLSLAAQQNTATLNKVSFYETLSTYFMQQPQPQPQQSSSLPSLECTPLLREIGWDLLTEIFLLYSLDERFSRFLLAICHAVSPRELSIMLSEVFTHPILSVNAMHHHFQLRILQKHYIMDDEDRGQQKQMMNLNLANKPMNMAASDDILAFHKNINYLKIQTLYIECVMLLFKRLTHAAAAASQGKNQMMEINHFYASLLPTAIAHFQALSKELSYQFYLHAMTQYHDHHQHQHGPHTPRHHHHHHCSHDGDMAADAVDAADENAAYAGVSALDATKKQAQEWLSSSKALYSAYLAQIYKLFALMVNHHCECDENDTPFHQHAVAVNVEELITVFHIQISTDDDDDDDDEKQTPLSKAKHSEHLNRLWLTRFGVGVVSGVYWWYNVVYHEDVENDGDINNDSMEILHNLKRPAYNIFMTDIVDDLRQQILVKLCHSLGMNGTVLMRLRDYLRTLETKLEAERPWHLNSDQMQVASNSNPSTPTPQLKPMSSIGHLDLNPIVEEQEDDMIDIKLDAVDASGGMDDEQDKSRPEVHTATISTHASEDHSTADADADDFGGDDDDDAGWYDNNTGAAVACADKNGFDDVDASKLLKMQETQSLVDELKTWNEYLPIFGVACYAHSLWVILQRDDCTRNAGESAVFKQHSKYVWQCIQLLMEQLTTLPAGIEFGEFILNTTVGKMSNKDLRVECKRDLDKLLSTAQFHEQGLWALVQYLTSQLKSINDRALHQKLWQFIVHLINAADLKTRFQCIVSTALQCPIPVVQSLMFTELKNQIFNNWNIADLGQSRPTKAPAQMAKGDDDNGDEEELVLAVAEDTLNPFCSSQVIMVLVQRLGRDLQNMSLQSIYQELDSLNACLNLCRFVLVKDKETNFTHIYDADCPLRQVLKTLYAEMTRISSEEKQLQQHGDKTVNGEDDDAKTIKLPELEQFQRQMMNNQFLVSLDLVKRILETYKV